ncbi:MAG: phosphoribosylformylglycinamidine synthase subunit PurQ [Phycisphaerales bacterium]
MTPTALIIRTAGTNCDRELAHAFELAGSETRTVHLSKLIDSPGA